MKKSIIGIIMSIFLLGMGISVSAEEPVKVFVNDRYLITDQPAIIYEDRTLVPMRAICEALYCEVEWDQDTSTATIKDAVRAVAVKIGSYQIATINRQNNEPSTIPIDVPAMIVNGRTMLPLRAVAEILDADVSWDQNSKTAFVNRPYDFIGEFYQGMAMVCKVHDDYSNTTYKYGYINEAGELTIPCEYDNNGFFYKETYYPAQKNGKWGVIDKFNRTIIPIEHDELSLCEIIDRDVCVVNKNGKYGMLDLNNTLLLPCEYDSIQDFRFISNKFQAENGLIEIRKDGKDGLADRYGNIIMECKYDWIFIYEDGTVNVSLNGVEKWGKLNETSY